MNPEEISALKVYGNYLVNDRLTVLCDYVLFGIFLVFQVYAFRLLWSRGLNSRHEKVLGLVCLFILVSSTVAILQETSILSTYIGVHSAISTRLDHSTAAIEESRRKCFSQVIFLNWENLTLDVVNHSIVLWRMYLHSSSRHPAFVVALVTLIGTAAMDASVISAMRAFRIDWLGLLVNWPILKDLRFTTAVLHLGPVIVPVLYNARMLWRQRQRMKVLGATPLATRPSLVFLVTSGTLYSIFQLAIFSWETSFFLGLTFSLRVDTIFTYIACLHYFLKMIHPLLVLVVLDLHKSLTEETLSVQCYELDVIVRPDDLHLSS